MHTMSESSSTDTIPSVLACDVGNSAVHFAAVRGESVGEMHTMYLDDLAALGPALAGLWREMASPKHVVAGSVNPAGLKAFEAAVAEAIGQPVLAVGRDLPLPIETSLEHPESVGVDRLCCAAAAFDHLGVACVVADFGTAITIDCVNDDGTFLGGAILPGLRMGAKSLQDGTALLPRVEPSEPSGVFGRDTQQAIAGGLVFGARGALRELVEAYATELGRWPLVIITGGDAQLICREPGASALVQARVDDLAVRGVAIAYYKTLVK